MCRSIQQLRRPDMPASETEIRAAAFDAAVDEIAEATQRLLKQLAAVGRAA